MKELRISNFTTIQHYVLGLGLIFPDKRDELAFLHTVGKRKRRRSSLLHAVCCVAWLSYVATTMDAASKEHKDRWRYAVAGAFMACTALSEFCAVIAAYRLSEWYYWRHEHLNAGLATASIFTIMEAGILLQSKEPPLFSVPVILFFHAAKLTVDQVRLSTAVWLWALQLGALVWMRIGQQIEGSGGSDMPAVAQALLLCSILGILVLGVVLEARTRLQFCRVHNRPRGALGMFWESVNVCLLRCQGAMRHGSAKMGRALRHPLTFFCR
ncbi:hypothetical protein WJX75_007149 [Coccomyxa subellipsoidea]|uniref:Transmembrane protein n=1 Tax=Coccomyxa subellipsoidea TaxID=248742 RepID=A0ABR2Z0H2_9CHLO